jgi:hypothetical protein
MPRSQQDSWEKVPPSKRRKDGPVFVREVALDNLRAMCIRLTTGDRSFEIMHASNTAVMVGARVGETVVVGTFRAQANRFEQEGGINPTVFLDVKRTGDCRDAKRRALFEVLLTCPTLWRDPASQTWHTHGEIACLSEGLSGIEIALKAGRVYCATCLAKGTTRYVKPVGEYDSRTYAHDSNDAHQLDRDHQATPGDKWRDTCTFCDIPGGNSGPPPDPDAPQPPTPKLDGQDPDSPIDPKALADMRERGGTWFAYVNMDLDSSNPGARQYLKCGEDCTLTTPPKHMPDTKAGLGWRYLYKGTVDTQTGLIAEGKWPGEPKP